MTLSLTAAKISGVVLDSKGLPVVDALVTLSYVPNPDWDRIVATDPHGAYSFGGLAPGSYKLFAGADDAGGDRIDAHESDQISRDLKLR